MTPPDLWEWRLGQSPVIAAAIHNGHRLRPEVARLMLLDEAARLREEDPYTGEWTTLSDNCIVVHLSRFEVDLNRSRGEAVYIEPADAWGLKIWKTRPPRDVIERSLAEYNSFYAKLSSMLKRLERRLGRFVVYDMHSYNHRRGEPGSPCGEPATHPDVNVGTGSLDRVRWAPVVDRFIRELGSYDFLGRRLDVRENVKFFGRQFARWIHGHFPASACVLAIDVKKFFMDEWTGIPDANALKAVGKALALTVPGVLEELSRLHGMH